MPLQSFTTGDCAEVATMKQCGAPPSTEHTARQFMTGLQGNDFKIAMSRFISQDDMAHDVFRSVPVGEAS